MDGTYYDRFVAELESLTNQSLDQQFTCTWENIESAITDAIGKNADIKLTEDYFAKKNPRVEGKAIKTAVHQIGKSYANFHRKTSVTFLDEVTKKEWSNEVAHRYRMYGNVWTYKVDVLPEQGMGEIKNWMKKEVSKLRNRPSKTLTKFTEDLEQFVEDKGLRNTYETYMLPSKNKNAINAAKQKI